MVMPKGLQKHNIRKALKARGVTPDKVDVEALIDSTLTYAENEARIFDRVGLTKERREKHGARKVSEKVREALRRNIERRQEARSWRARLTDSAKAARKVFPPIGRLTNREAERWMNSPDEYDIKGVDYPVGKKVRRYFRRLRRNDQE